MLKNMMKLMNNTLSFLISIESIKNAELQKLKKRMLYEVQKPSLLRHLISHNASF